MCACILLCLVGFLAIGSIFEASVANTGLKLTHGYFFFCCRGWRTNLRNAVIAEILGDHSLLRKISGKLDRVRLSPLSPLGSPLPVMQQFGRVWCGATLNISRFHVFKFTVYSRTCAERGFLSSIRCLIGDLKVLYSCPTWPSWFRYLTLEKAPARQGTFWNITTA